MKALLVLGLVLAANVASANVCFFEHARFGGASFCRPGDDRMDDLLRSGWNDRISSITIDPGSSVTVCSDGGFRGNCQTLNSTISDLSSIRMNDAVSSISITSRGPVGPGGPGGGPGGPGGGHGGGGFPGGPGGPGGGGGFPGGPGGGGRDQVCFYEHDNFQGRSICLGERDRIRDLVANGMNDTISSVRVPRGLVAELCRDLGFSGGCIEVRDDAPSLNDRRYRFNDAASSLEVRSEGRRR